MTFVCHTHSSIAELGEGTWTRLVEGAGPFLSYAWLSALETTGCVGERRGAVPCYVSVTNDGEVVGAAPAFVKSHSDGEFVFDHAWADFAKSRLGVRYYPKLVVGVPFTPATGPRLLVLPGRDRELVIGELLAGLHAITEELGLSSFHVLFPDDAEATDLEGRGLLRRQGVQFQWQNQGYEDFDAFLHRFSSKRRHQIRRERQALDSQGTTIETVTGSGLTPEMADLAYEFYVSTVDKFVWGRRYLNRDFFVEVCDKLRSAVRLVVARDARTKRPLAGAFNLASRDVLYGRYWGAREERPFLHFNVCFYHSIEECIREGLGHFEPGAGGEHKVARGFEPTLTESVHYLAHPVLRGAVADFLERERRACSSYVAEYQAAPVLRSRQATSVLKGPAKAT